MPKAFRFAGLLVLSSCLLIGQQYRFDVYEQAQGLSNLEVHAIAFDRQGYLWVGTVNGVFKFLGSHFEHYGPEQGLKDRAVDELAIDGEGRIWVAAAGNLYLWKENRFQQAVPEHSWPGYLDGLISVGKNKLLMIGAQTVVECIINDSGVLTSSKPIFSDSQLSVQPELKSIFSLRQAKNGTLWMGCGNQICSYDKGLVKVWGPKNGVPETSWYQLLIDHKGGVWARGNGRLIYHAGESDAFVDRSPPQTSPSRYFPWVSLMEDRSGRIVLNKAAGVARWDGEAWRVIGKANGFDSGTTTSLAQDQNGDLWIGTLSGIWHWVGYEHWENWTEAQGLPSNTIWSLYPALDSNILVGTAKGPALVTPMSGQVESPFTTKKWPWAQVKGISQNADGSIWMTTNAGNVLRGGSRLDSIQSAVDLRNLAVRFWLDKNSRGWIAAESGVYSFDTRSPKSTLKQEVDPSAWGGKPALISLAPGATNSPDTELWISTQHVLLAKRAGEWKKPEVLGVSLQSIKISEVSEGTNGVLYACGEDHLQQSAVWRLDRASGGKLQASRIPLPEQLHSAVAFSILADRRNWLWLGTDRGLAGWNGKQWRVFNRESGLIWDDTNRNVLREGLDGSIWIGTSGGLAHLMSPETVFDTVSLPMKIDSATEEGVVSSAATLKDVPWEHNRLRFQFSSPAMWNRSTLSFHYRIPELDSAWTSTQNTDAAFSNLPPGGYRFQVFADNVGTGSRSEVVESSFRILPPWWRTCNPLCDSSSARATQAWL